MSKTGDEVYPVMIVAVQIEQRAMDLVTINLEIRVPPGVDTASLYGMLQTGEVGLCRYDRTENADVIPASEPKVTIASDEPALRNRRALRLEGGAETDGTTECEPERRRWNRDVPKEKGDSSRRW